ncbi:MAG: chemotaxis protein CheD [Desulfobulbaceae bacterium]|nr:chemotaxis protein CheD [Desulfobulbaceae bacterium]
MIQNSNRTLLTNTHPKTSEKKALMQLISSGGKPKKIVILSGEYLAVDRDITLSTTLGSCVAVCLFDPVNNVRGMNHILVSHDKYSKSVTCNPSEGKYGHCAMDLLIEDMIALGARIKNIKAKAFGGSSMFEANRSLSGYYCIGKINISFVTMFLQERGIPLIAEDLGGSFGRIINFLPHPYTVEVKTLNKLNSLKLLKKESSLSTCAAA